ncbi:MAG: glycoside hydrolase family 5 protein [bacterium]
MSWFPPALYASDPPAVPALRPLQTPSELPKTKWDLWKNGTYLRGANIYQRRVFPALDGLEFLGPGPMGPPYTQEDFNQLAAWGANYVNISYSGLFRVDPPYEVDPEVQHNLDDLLDMAVRADLFAVLSFRSGPGRSDLALFYWDSLDKRYFNDKVWNSPAAQDAWVQMWRYTAARYRNHPVIVGYDLMVEPNSNQTGSDYFTGRLDIWDPGEFYARYQGTLYDWNQLHPRIVAAIREVDPDTPVLIGGNSYSSVSWLPYVTPVNDPRVVYTAHQYEPFDSYTHKDWRAADFGQAVYPGRIDLNGDGTKDNFNRAWLNAQLRPIDTFITQNHAPVAVNEFGVMRWENNAGQYLRDQMELFELRGMNHALWLWESSWPPYSAVDDFNVRHGPDPRNHAEAPASDLITAIREAWARNQIRPSQMNPPSAIQDFEIHP